MNVAVKSATPKALGILLLIGLTACNFSAASTTLTLPNPKFDPPAMAGAGMQTAVFSGGCFWGIEAVFEHVKGVEHAWSGYAGGSAATAYYELVGAGDTGHAESVKVKYDPSKISYGQLLKVFFSVAHDPTQLNRQGPDRGRQYRSAIFAVNAEQQRVAAAYIAQLQSAKVYSGPIVTQLAPLKTFFPAESYHQEYARLNPGSPYIVYHDLPKVARLKQQFPHLYREWTPE